MSEPVQTRVGLTESGDVVLVFDAKLDTVQYPLDAAEEVANTMIELIKQARESLTKD